MASEIEPYEAYRRQIRDLNILAQRDMNQLFKAGTHLTPDILAELVETYGSAAASISADWFDELRDASGVPGRFVADIPEPEAPGTSQLLNWASAKASDSETFQSLILGGLQRRITNYGRDVVVNSTYRDTNARGWMRVGTPDCDFCAMLISRGSVYKKDTVRFRTHDYCDCSAAPVWNQGQLTALTKKFVPSARRRSEETKAEDAARARAWIAENL